jgi:hypothetical protein
VVRRAIANSLFSILLVTTLLGGGCVSCEQFFMWPGAKSCCMPDGRCKTKPAPAKERSGEQCKQLAFDHHKSIDHKVTLAVTAWALEAPPTLYPEIWTRSRRAESLAPSPPDLLILNSAFLI